MARMEAKNGGFPWRPCQPTRLPPSGGTPAQARERRMDGTGANWRVEGQVTTADLLLFP